VSAWEYVSCPASLNLQTDPTCPYSEPGRPYPILSDPLFFAFFWTVRNEAAEMSYQFEKSTGDNSRRLGHPTLDLRARFPAQSGRLHTNV